MKTNQKVNGPMMIAAVVIATGVFLLLALVTYERDHYENPQLYPPATNFIESTFYAVSHAQFASLGGAA